MPHFTKRALSALTAVGLSALLAATTASAQSTILGSDGKTVITIARSVGVQSLTDADIANAKSRLPMLTDLSQVPGLQSRINQGYGTDNHPFTTKGAYSTAPGGAPVNQKPWRSTGKLFMQFGGSTFVCTASVIAKGILVTAAHCVQNYGLGAGGSADSVWFQPARHGGILKIRRMDCRRMGRSDRIFKR